MIRGLQRCCDEVSEPDVDAVVEVPREVVIAELLELCDRLFATAGPVVHVELDAFLISRGLHPATALAGSMTC